MASKEGVWFRLRRTAAAGYESLRELSNRHSLVVALIVVLVMAYPLWWLNQQFTPPAPRKSEYLLYPGAATSPDTCPLHQKIRGRLLIVLSEGTGISVPRPIDRRAVVYLGGVPIIELEGSPGGHGLNIYAKVQDPIGRELVRIEGNKLIPSPVASLKIDQSTDSEVTVVNPRTNELILRAQFLNEETFRLEGRFAGPTGTALVS